MSKNASNTLKVLRKKKMKIQKRIDSVIDSNLRVVFDEMGLEETPFQVGSTDCEPSPVGVCVYKGDEDEKACIFCKSKFAFE